MRVRNGGKYKEQVRKQIQNFIWQSMITALTMSCSGIMFLALSEFAHFSSSRSMLCDFGIPTWCSSLGIHEVMFASLFKMEVSHGRYENLPNSRSSFRHFSPFSPFAAVSGPAETSRIMVCAEQFAKKSCRRLVNC